MDHPTAKRWIDRTSLKTRDDIELRIRDLTAKLAYAAPSERDPVMVAEVEILVSAAFVDPVADTPRGRMPLSRALLAFQNSSAADFKKIFAVGDYGTDFDEAYGLAREVVGRKVALALMEDVLTETDDAAVASILVIERMVSPASRYRRFATPSPAPVPAAFDQHPALV